MKKNKFFILALAAFSATLLVFAGCSKKESSKSIDIEKLKASAPALESEFEVKMTSDSNGVIITKYKGPSKGGMPKAVVIPATIQGLPVKEIGQDAFKSYGDPWLYAVVIPEGVEIIGNGAFDVQVNLVTVVLPSSLKVIGIGAFGSNKKLTTIDFPKNLMMISGSAFSYTGLTSIDLPEGLLAIGVMAFSDTPLTAVTLPKSLKILNGGAFSDCDNLTEINIPDGLSVACSNPIYEDGKLKTNSYEKPITFDSIFSGAKIKESLAFQKKLQEYKTVSINFSNLKYDDRGFVYSSDWDW